MKIFILLYCIAFSHLGPDILLSTLILDSINIYSFFNVKPSSEPVKSNSQSIQCQNMLLLLR
jgi:hypothetical protein